MRSSHTKSTIVILTALLSLSSSSVEAESTLSSLKKCSKWNWATRDNCFGKWNDENGNVYEGEWARDQFSGWGMYTAANGDKYVGEFKDDKFNGQGTYTYKDGRVDFGEFKDGKLNGPGTYTATNGDKYVGEFKDDSFDGYGTYTFADGDKYIGEFKEDRFNGQGVYYNADGSISEQGLYKDGVLAQPLDETTSTISSSTRSDGVALVEQGGTYAVPVTINDVLPLNFVLDSGASDVSIPADVVLTLIRTGTLKESDFIGSQTYQLADGSTIESKQFTIRSITVGGRRVADVTGSIADVKGSLLLGQSFLQKFKSWSIDNDQHKLFLD